MRDVEEWENRNALPLEEEEEMQSKIVNRFRREIRGFPFMTGCSPSRTRAARPRETLERRDRERLDSGRVREGSQVDELFD